MGSWQVGGQQSSSFSLLSDHVLQDFSGGGDPQGPAGRDVSAPSFLKFTKGRYRPLIEVQAERQPSLQGPAPACSALPQPQQWSWVSPSFLPGIFRGCCGPDLARRLRVSREVWEGRTLQRRLLERTPLSQVVTHQHHGPAPARLQVSGSQPWLDVGKFEN